MLQRFIKGSRALKFVLAIALMFSLAACDDNGGRGEEQELELLSDILESRRELSTFLGTVEASGQSDSLDQENITVFAPNDDAFTDINLEAALSDDNFQLLEEVVKYHMLPQLVLSSDLSEGTVTTVAGDDIRVTTDEDGNFLINGNTITTADREAENGVLHVIDGLLLENRTLVERLGLTSSTESLAGLASEASLGDTFVTAENWTVFAPINAALDGVDPADFSQEELQQILQYHVIVDEGGPIDSEALLGLLADSDGEVSVPTAQGEEIIFTETDSGISINGGDANIVLEGGVDRFAGGVNEAGDGYVNVFHLIDGLLMPPDETVIIGSGADPVEVAFQFEPFGADDVSEEGTLTLTSTNSDDLGSQIQTFVGASRGDVVSAEVRSVRLERLTTNSSEMVQPKVFSYLGSARVYYGSNTDGQLIAERDPIPDDAEVTMDRLNDDITSIVQDEARPITLELEVDDSSLIGSSDEVEITMRYRLEVSI